MYKYWVQYNYNKNVTATKIDPDTNEPVEFPTTESGYGEHTVERYKPAAETDLANHISEAKQFDIVTITHVEEREV